jgi:hypothetical protein
MIAVIPTKTLGLQGLVIKDVVLNLFGSNSPQLAAGNFVINTFGKNHRL